MGKFFVRSVKSPSQQITNQETRHNSRNITPYYQPLHCIGLLAVSKPAMQTQTWRAPVPCSLQRSRRLNRLQPRIKSACMWWVMVGLLVDLFITRALLNKTLKLRKLWSNYCLANVTYLVCIARPFWLRPDPFGLRAWRHLCRRLFPVFHDRFNNLSGTQT